jgi:DNA invertase Pin-like site-specific DNA recombinase
MDISKTELIMKQLLLVTLVFTALIAYASGNKDGAAAKKKDGGNKPEAKSAAKSEQKEKDKEKWKNFLETLFEGSKKSGDKKIRALAKGGMSWTEIAEEVGVTKQTVYRVLLPKKAKEHRESNMTRY